MLTHASLRPSILLTGAKGKFARFVIPALMREFDCHYTDICPSANPDPGYQRADLCNFDEVNALFTRPYDAVIHMAIASKTNANGVPGEGEEPSDQTIMNVNVQGTYNLFEAARRAGVKKIIYISSLTVYLGERHRPIYDPVTALSPRNLYACTKIFGEYLAQMYASQFGVSTICLRIGQPFPFKASQDDLWRSNKRLRSFYVANEDIVQAILCSLRADVSYGVFNIVSASDNQRVSLSEARQIGYSPRGYFSDEGFMFCEEWERPPMNKAEIVTHDPVTA